MKTVTKILLPLIALTLASCNFLNPLGPDSNPVSDTSTTTTTSDPTSDPTTGTTTRPSSSSSKTSSTSTSSTPAVYPTSISIEASKTVEIGDTFTLNVTYTPSNTTVRNVTWSSSNSNVATVDNGFVTAIKDGAVNITASAKNKWGLTISSTCAVTIRDPSLHKVKLQSTYDDFFENEYFNLNNCPLVGNPKLLVIPVWFTDSDTFIREDMRENVRDDIRKTYIGTNEETGWRSVKTYYEEESKGIMSLNATITDWYESSHSYVDYKSGQNATVSLVNTAAKWYFDNNPTDSKSNYDTNGDGYFDGVMLIYAAPDYQSLGQSSNNLWAYCFWVQQYQTTQDPIPNVFFWASYDFMYNSSKAYQRTGQSYYSHGDCSHSNVDSHTFIHEMGHVLGLEDYYDYSGNSTPAGGFSMQDYNVGGHDPYSVMAYGWADPYIPYQSSTITISSFQDSHDLILLANHNVTSPFDEYLLLELYTPTGLNKFDTDHMYRSSYPQGPSDTGIRLWHVDARLLAIDRTSGNDFITCDPITSENKYLHSTTNTVYTSSTAGRFNYPAFKDYNMLELIRNNSYEGYPGNSILSTDDLFKEGESFSMSAFDKQFQNGAYLDDMSTLGWSFTVNTVTSTSATITLTYSN